MIKILISNNVLSIIWSTEVKYLIIKVLMCQTKVAGLVTLLKIISVYGME